MDQIVTILEDVSESRGRRVEQAIRALRASEQPTSGTATAAISLPLPAMEDLLLAATIHGLSDLWVSLREEGITIIDQEEFPSMLSLLLQRPEFQRRLRQAVRQSLADSRR